jgi:hypothetical protein
MSSTDLDLSIQGVSKRYRIAPRAEQAPSSSHREAFELVALAVRGRCGLPADAAAEKGVRLILDGGGFEAGSLEHIDEIAPVLLEDEVVQAARHLVGMVGGLHEEV